LYAIPNSESKITTSKFISISFYFPKMKVGLANLYEMCYGGNAIQGHLDAVIFNPIDPIILKLLRYKFVK
jgi:hypothetical protein